MKLLKAIPLFFPITFITLIITSTLGLFMIRNSPLHLGAMWDLIGFIFICSTFLVYNITFYTKNNNSVEFINYKLNWLSELFILMSVLGVSLTLFYVLAGMDTTPPPPGVDPIAQLGSMVAVSLLTIIYGFSYAISTRIYKSLMVNTLDDLPDSDITINKNFRKNVIFNLILFLILFSFGIFVNASTYNLGISHIFNHNAIYLLILLGLLPILYQGNSFLNLFKSWFWYFEDDEKEIKININYLTFLKNSIATFYCISLLITPMLVYGAITAIENPFYPLQNAINLFFVSGIFILLLSIMQGQQVNKLFLITGETVSIDRYFALKFYLLPAFLLYIYFSFCVVMGFVLI